MKRFLCAAVAALALLVLPDAIALAQTASAPVTTTITATSPTTVDIGAGWTSLQTWVLTIVGSLAGLLVGWLATIVSKKTGISISDSMRATIQTAVTNAAGLALNKLGNQLQGKTIDVHNPIIADVLNYVIKAAPDAIEHFGLTPDHLKEMILAKLPQVANTTTPAAAPGA